MFKFYQKHIFPPILNQVMQTASLMDARRELILPIQANVLEIGFGTGLNLAFYSNVDTVYALEPSLEVFKFAQQRLTQTSFEVRHLATAAEHIPLADQSMDHIVSTWTLCSIANLEQALKEVYRVLKPQGTFHLVEHVLSDQPRTQRWQNLLNPIQKRVADGCHLNRNIEQALERAGFQFLEKRYFHAEGIPKIGQRMLLARVQKLA